MTKVNRQRTYIKYRIQLILLTLFSMILVACGTDDGFSSQNNENTLCINSCSENNAYLTEDLGDGLLKAADITYQPSDGWDPNFSKLDLYYSDQQILKGTVVYVHGGSWVSEDKASFPEITEFARFFVNRGLAVASINYRLLLNEGAKGTTYKDQAQDIAQSLSYLANNGSKINAPFGNFILYGHSSGAHMVALIGTDKRYLERAGLSLKDLNGVISSDVHNYDIPWAITNMVGTNFEENIPMQKKLFGSTIPLQREASPSSYVNDPNIPPMLLISAGYDSGNRLYENEITDRAQIGLKNQLIAAGHRAIHVHFKNDNHASLLLDFGKDSDAPTQSVNQFLDNL